MAISRRLRAARFGHVHLRSSAAIVLGGVVTLAVAGLWAGILFPMPWQLQSFEQLKDPKANGASRA
jgi:hypothetical protein